MSPASLPQHRNPGPSWGYGFLRLCDSYLPGPIFDLLLWLGSGIGLLLMPGQRQYSKQYLRIVLRREPTLKDGWIHFHTFMLSLMELFRLGRGAMHEFIFRDEQENEFDRLARSADTAFFGTFHVGNSDLLGYALSRYNRRVRMVRLRMRNSNETNWLGQQFAEHLSFIWVDRPENILFQLKEAIQSGCSIAMKCDRTETSTKREYFQFLGAEREFPFTIYHLACVFSMPVAYSIGYAEGKGRTLVISSSVFRPDPSLTRQENLEVARKHFQTVLNQVEELLRQNPYLWFNFSAMNRCRNESALKIRDVFDSPGVQS